MNMRDGSSKTGERDGCSGAFGFGLSVSGEARHSPARAGAEFAGAEFAGAQKNTCAATLRAIHRPIERPPPRVFFEQTFQPGSTSRIRAIRFLASR